MKEEDYARVELFFVRAICESTKINQRKRCGLSINDNSQLGDNFNYA